jgi:hypothetical protein
VDLEQPGGEEAERTESEADGEQEPDMGFPVEDLHDPIAEEQEEEGAPQDGRTVLEILLAMAANNPDQPDGEDVGGDDNNDDNNDNNDDNEHNNDDNDDNDDDNDDDDDEENDDNGDAPARSSSPPTLDVNQAASQHNRVERAGTGPALALKEEEDVEEPEDGNTHDSSPRLDAPNQRDSHTDEADEQTRGASASLSIAQRASSNAYSSSVFENTADALTQQQQQLITCPSLQESLAASSFATLPSTRVGEEQGSSERIVPPAPQSARPPSNSQLFDGQGSREGSGASPDVNSLSHTLASLTAAAEHELSMTHPQDKPSEHQHQSPIPSSRSKHDALAPPQPHQTQSSSANRGDSPMHEARTAVQAKAAIPPGLPPTTLAAGAAAAVASLIPAAGTLVPPTRSPTVTPGHSPMASPGTARGPVRIRVAEADATNRTEPLPWASVYNASATAEAISAQVREMRSTDLIQAAAQLSAGSVRRRVWANDGDEDAKTKKGHRRSQSLHDFLAAANAAQAPRDYSPNTQRATQFATLRFSSTDSRRRETLFTAGRTTSANVDDRGSGSGDYADTSATSSARSSMPSTPITTMAPQTAATAEPPRRRTSFLQLFRKSRDRLSVPDTRYGMSLPSSPAGKPEKSSKDKEKHVCSAINEGLSRCECGRTW